MKIRSDGERDSDAWSDYRIIFTLFIPFILSYHPS
jgi:hypothetical protein